MTRASALPGRRLNCVVDVLGTGIQELGAHGGRRLLELRKLGVDQVPLEGRHDDQVDEHQSGRHDDRQPEPEAGADTAERVHRSRNR